MTDTPIILSFPDGMRFKVGSTQWAIEPLAVSAGSWVAMLPDLDEPVIDPSGTLARTIATMSDPIRGQVQLWGRDIYRIEYSVRQRLRSNIGFVHGYGGLLSSRTVRENVTLPVSVHGGLNIEEENKKIDHWLSTFSLEKVAQLKPHEMDGATRWKACLARATVLHPSVLVLEGLGNWEMDRGRGTGWAHLLKRRLDPEAITVICLARKNPEFEQWFLEYDGTIVRYRQVTEATSRRTSA